MSVRNLRVHPHRDLERKRTARMTRAEKIRQVLLDHGCQDANFDWKSHNFEEAHFYEPFGGGLIIVRIHRNLNNLIEVFRVKQFFCAGDDGKDWDAMPGMNHVLNWLPSLIAGEPLLPEPRVKKPA
jgi:hypothetical protein